MAIIPETEADYQNMMLTCCHEAGHAVLATYSQFHWVSSDIRINATTVASTGIWTADENIEAAKQHYSAAQLARKLAVDYAVIMFAGRFAEERLAAIRSKAGEHILLSRQGWQLDELEARSAFARAEVGKCGQILARIQSWWLVRKYWQPINIVTDEIIRQGDFVLRGERIRQLCLPTTTGR